MTTKTCTKCNEEKPLEAFSIYARGKFGRHPQCKDCRNKYMQRRYANGLRPERRSREAERDTYFQRKYGMSLEEVTAFLLDRPCDICHAEVDLVIDHCHETGAVRGALCPSCNIALGHMQDDAERLIRAAHYLTG